ncbi:hypothetical protein BH18THE2_BH18THE2_34700 [soil metagenome]
MRVKLHVIMNGFLLSIIAFNRVIDWDFVALINC